MVLVAFAPSVAEVAETTATSHCHPVWPVHVVSPAPAAEALRRASTAQQGAHAESLMCSIGCQYHHVYCYCMTPGPQPALHPAVQTPPAGQYPTPDSMTVKHVLTPG